MAHKLDFCSLCYGSLAVDDDGIRCKRCGSSFDVDGNVVERRNAHIAPEVAAAIDAGALQLETIDGQVSAIELPGVTTAEQAQRVAMRDLKPRVRLRTDGSDWLDYAVTPEEQVQREAHFSKHVLYEREDADAPDIIKDANGDITLGLCKICGKGEAELVEPCEYKPKEPLGHVYLNAYAANGGGKLFDRVYKVEDPEHFARFVAAYAEGFADVIEIRDRLADGT